MKTIIQLFSIITIIALVGCSPTPPARSLKKTALIKKDISIENERNKKLISFVGEKINVTRLPYSVGDFDAGVKAKYLIIQQVYGEYDNDTIEFEAYDHHGDFSFAEYKNVLLYISEYKGKWYHEKYTYDPVFKTKDGHWAGSFSGDYNHPYNEATTVKPILIDFPEDVSFPTTIMYEDGQELSLSYQEPYFKIIGNKAFPVYGNFVPELFRLKKEGVLTARQLFGDRKPDTLEVEIDIDHKSKTN